MCIIRMSYIVLLFFFLSGCGRSNTIWESAQTEESGLMVDEEAINTVEAVHTVEAVTTAEDIVIYVDICGAVKNPGVYSLPEGSRIYELVALSGGFCEDARSDLINQARVLQDGEQIRVLSIEEAEAIADEVVVSYHSETGEENGHLININQADKNQLMLLTGIGATRAEAIIRYREQNGFFSSIEDLMKVDGIKEKTYEKLKDEITVQ